MDFLNQLTFEEIFGKKPKSDEKGLENFRGENNCFLNVVIQALWHLEPFRTKFGSVNGVKRPHNHQEPCVYCSIEIIFAQYEFSEETEIPPTILRQTLAYLFKPQTRFQMYELDDAAEAFEAILQCLHKELDMDNPMIHPKFSTEGLENCLSSNCLAHNVFGVRSYEQLRCDACGTASEPMATTLFTAYSYAAALRTEYSKDPTASFCKLIAAAGQEKKCCSNQSCGKVSNVIHYLQTLPEVFSVGVVWDSAEPSVTSIDIILRMISLRIDLNNVFVFGEPNKNSQMGARAKAPCYYRFRGMICYYGKHYVAYFYNFKSKLWYVYDDTNVQPVGSEWPMIRDRCLRGRLQPNIIFYEREGFDTVPEENFNPFQSIIDQDLAQLRISKVDLPLEEETKSEESDPEDFVFIPREDSKEDVDILVTRTNWLYRRQERRYRFKEEEFQRIIPGSGTVKESFAYKDVLDITFLDDTDIVIRFYSGKEAQYIRSVSVQDIVQILIKRSQAIGHSFPVIKAE